MADNDKAAIEALLRVRNQSNYGENTGVYAVTYTEGARAILAAIRAGKVPGVYCASGDFHDLWQAAEKDKDAWRARCAELGAQLGRATEEKEAAEKALDLACQTRNAAVDATKIVCLKRDQLRAEVELYKNGAACRAEERDSARAERDNFKRRLIEAEDGRARMHAERDAEKARADEAEAANKLLRSELIPVGWDVLEQSGCPRCGDDVVAEPAMDGDGFLDGNPARCQSCGLSGQVVVDEESAHFSADDSRWEVEEESKRADKMKADGERAVMEERNRTDKGTAERDRLAGLLIESNRLLKDAKRHLGPNTTNSDADTAIARNDAALAEIGGGG